MTLVVGVGKGTKRLSEFLDCVKVFHSLGLPIVFRFFSQDV